jgi:hypothetical protein
MREPAGGAGICVGDHDYRTGAFAGQRSPPTLPKEIYRNGIDQMKNDIQKHFPILSAVNIPTLSQHQRCPTSTNILYYD